MATLKALPARLLRAAALSLAVGAQLLLLLLAALLLLVAPLPQLAAHVGWCLRHPVPLGAALLLLGLLGAAAVAAGLGRGRAALHRAGAFLVLAPVAGVALHRAAAAGDWQDLPLLGAFLFSTLLAYLAASEGV